jgi:2-haloacid dehalogenase
MGPDRITTLVFDILGTVVDERGSMARELAAALTAVGEDPSGAPELTGAWLAALDGRLAEVRAGRAVWRRPDDLAGEALRATLADAAVGSLSDEAVAALGHAGHRLIPWPDSAAAIDRLAGRFKLVALSNAGFAQLADLFAAGRLTWHATLSTELAGTFKPDPAAYRLVFDRLDLDPDRTLFVAAHVWDLRSAGSHGFATAYVERGEGGAAPDAGEFDWRAGSLAELADVLIA